MARGNNVAAAGADAGLQTALVEPGPLGRRPNSDRLGLETTEIETEDRCFIETNEYLETTANNVWAQGDIAGNAMFKHSGDYETRITVANAVHKQRAAIDLSAIPHTFLLNRKSPVSGQPKQNSKTALSPLPLAPQNIETRRWGGPRNSIVGL